MPEAEKDGFDFIAWVTEPGSYNMIIGTADIEDSVLASLTDNVVTLYAWWEEDSTPNATFEVEHYKEKLNGTGYDLAETDTERDVAIGTILKAVDYAKTYEGFTLDTERSVNVKVENDGHFVLEIYYNRNVYTLNYDYCDADTTGIASATFKYGKTITLPEEGTYEKAGFIATGWYKTEEYKDEDLLDEAIKIEEIVDIAGGKTEATIYVKWDNFFTVTFQELGMIKHTSKVYPEVSNTVPQADIDTAYANLVNPYIVGYRKDATVSPIYAATPFEHRLNGNWYYENDGKYILFTNETVVDRDLIVRYMFRKAGLELNLPKLSQIIEPTFEVPFEEDTRAFDTVKDATFLFEEKLLTAFGALDADQKFNKVNDKLVSLLDSKGLKVTPGRVFADDGEILKQHIQFNGFAYLDEAQTKSVVVKAIKTTFRNDPLRMRGVIDEMMVEKDPDVVTLMDDMLVTMLSGSDSARIKGIIADAVEEAVKNDTTGEFKTKIKNIIIAQLDAGNVTVENSVKDAIKDYFMNSANDDEIKDIVKDLIDQAYATDDDSDPVRAFVKGYIVEYFNDNHNVLDDMIRELGAELENDSDPVNQHIIGLIKEMLMEEGNEAYLEELVDDAVENLHNKVGTDLYNFIVDAITEELTSNAGELETLIRAISDTHVEDLTEVLKSVMEDDDTFETIVTSAISDEAVFKKVLKTALNDVVAFKTIITDLCEDEEFYNLIIDIALSSDTLKAEVKNAVIENDDALIRVIKEIATDNTLKEEIIEEILAAGDEELKSQLTSPLDASSDYYADVKEQALNQAEDKIVDIIENGINETEHPEYWPYAFAKAMEVAEAKVVQDLINNGVDPNGSLWDTLYQDAMAQAEIDVTSELNGGITDASDYYTAAINGAKEKAEDEIEDLLATGISEGSEYWDVAYQTAKEIAKDKIVADFDSKVEEIKTNADIKAEVKAWAENAINRPEVEDAIKDLAKGLATSADADDIALKADIIETVIETVENSAQADKDILVDDIITEILKPANSAVKVKVIEKAIEVINDDGNEALKADLIDSVLEDVFADDSLKNDLIDELIVEVQTDDALKQTVVNEAIDAVVYDDIVNAEAIDILNNLIENDDVFKANIVAHMIEYILDEDDVRSQAMEKVITKIESSDAERNEAIDFAFDVLKENTTKRAEIAEKFLTSILGNNSEREALATDVIDVMFDDATLRNEILDLGFEQMFSSADTISEIVELALDQLIADDEVRLDMILAVIETEDGREGILDILFDELERDSAFLDKMVDIAMKGKYGDMVDIFVSDLINVGKIQINPDNRQIAEEIVLPMLDDITLDTIMSKLPSKVTDVLPESKIEAIFNKFKSKARENLVEGIEEAKEGNSKDIKVMIDNDIDVVNSILIPAYNKVFPRVIDKAEDFYYYNENQYIKAIVDMLDPEYILDHTQPASEMGTGYRVRDSRYYYEMLRNTMVLADDAGQWYLDNISDEQIDKAISKFMNAYTKIITKADSLVGGRIPEDKINTVINYVEKAIDKRQDAYDSTTNGGFERVDALYTKIIEFVKEKIGADLSTDTVIEVTFDGSELTLNDDKSFNIDNYKINVNVKGYTFKLDSHAIVVAGKTVDISGVVQKIADKFGTRSVTIKFSEEVPYSYELSVGNYSIKVSAFYEG